jgi:hypothetical protein
MAPIVRRIPTWSAIAIEQLGRCSECLPSYFDGLEELWANTPHDPEIELDYEHSYFSMSDDKRQRLVEESEGPRVTAWRGGHNPELALAVDVPVICCPNCGIWFERTTIESYSDWHVRSAPELITSVGIGRPTNAEAGSPSRPFPQTT